MKRKGGMVSWILFLFVLLIGGVVLMIVAGIAMGESFFGFQLSNEVTVEQQIAFTASSGSTLQIPSSVLLTEFEDGTVMKTVERFVYCRDRVMEYGCGEDSVSESELNNALENRMNRIFNQEVFGSQPYFIRVFRDNREVHSMSRGGIETVVRSGETIPQFESQTTSIRLPLAIPGDETASIEFVVPVGGMDVSVHGGVEG